MSWSQDPDRVGRHPDIDLREPRLQPSLELDEEPAMFGLVGDVYKDANQVIAIGLAFVSPHAADRLRFGRYGSVWPLQFEQRVSDKIIWNGLTVIEPERQQDLVAPE